MKEEFEKYLEANNPQKSGTIKGYLKNLEILNNIIDGKFKSISILKESEIELLEDLYEYVKEQQRLGKKGCGIFVNSKEASWRWEKNHYSAAINKYIEFLQWKKPTSTVFPEFPSNQSKKPHLRRKKLHQEIKTYPEKKYKKRLHSVRVSLPQINPKIYLKSIATNADGIMVCQMCEEEMPFKLQNGEYYFESIEIDSNFPIETHQLYLALCPECAAKYKTFIKQDKKVLKNVLKNISKLKNKNTLDVKTDWTMPLKIRFTDIHLLDIQTILKARSKKLP